MYTTEVTGFCIASSDSDYTRLATRIREQNLFVLGIGRRSTPQAFVSACNIFVYTENLEDDEPSAAVKSQNGQVKSSKMKKAVNNNSKKQLRKLFNTAFNLVVQDNGWAHLGALGSALRQVDPGFDPRTYGYKQLSQLVEAHPNLIKVRKTGHKDKPIYHIQLL